MKLLTDNLVKCEYLDKSKVKTNYSSYVVYDENVADAVKRIKKLRMLRHTEFLFIPE